jgi:preprotein translocase subunit YajC
LSIPAFLAAAASFVAQVTPPPTTGPTSRPSAPPIIQFFQNMGILLPMTLVLVLLFVMSSRSRKRQERQKQEMMNQMKRGDRVQTIGGILGAVVEVRDDKVLLKVDESNNTKVWFARSAIHRVLGDEAEAKK